jgi:hypothetical protein
MCTHTADYGVTGSDRIICTSELIEVWSCLVFHVDYQWVSSRVLILGVWDVVERDSVGTERGGGGVQVTHCTWLFHYDSHNEALWSPLHCSLVIGNPAHAALGSTTYRGRPTKEPKGTVAFWQGGKSGQNLAEKVKREWTENRVT